MKLRMKQLFRNVLSILHQYRYERFHHKLMRINGLKDVEVKGEK